MERERNQVPELPKGIEPPGFPEPPEFEQNLLWINVNPKPENICPMCAFFIGKVFTPENALRLPAHPGCWCLYVPTWQPADEWDWGDLPEDALQGWIRLAAWLLRMGFELTGALIALRGLAEAYNRAREEEEEDEEEQERNRELERWMMGFSHDSKLAEGEPAWSDVDKTRLPDKAFADMDERKYPHHWVQGGGDLDDDGRYTSGTMYLHKGGLNAAWSAAHGARSGQDAPASITAHLRAHRRAISVEEEQEVQEGMEGTVTESVDSVSTSCDTVTVDPVAVSGDFLQDGRVAPVLERAMMTSGQVHINVRLQDGEDRRRRYLATIISSGMTANGWELPAAVLREAVDLFAGAPCCVDHPGFLSLPKLSAWAGTFEEPHYYPQSETVGLANGRLRVVDTPAGDLLTRIFDAWLEDQDAGLEISDVGLSAVLWLEMDRSGDHPVAQRIHKVESVDAVLHPAAGGRVERVLNQYVGGFEMPEQERQEQVGSVAVEEPMPPPAADEAAQVVEPAAEDLVTQRLERLERSLAQLTDGVTTLAQVQAEAEEERTIQGMGEAPRSPVVRSMLTGMDQVEAAFDALLLGRRPPDGIKPISGIRELYFLLSGDYEMTGRYHPERVYLANVTASTMAGLVANRLNKRVMIQFAEYPRWWEPVFVEEDFNSLQDIRWITLGGVGELPTVAEGAAYTEMTWDDLTQVTSFVKKGGYLGLTLEAIDRDDTRQLLFAPRALAQGAYLTLSRSCSAIFTDNSGVGPNVYYDDSNTRALFHSSNSNLGTSALSAASWEATRIAMRKQTEHNSGERLGALTAPRYCLVPPDLEFTAIQVLATAQIPVSADWNINPEAEGDARTERLRVARERVVVVDLWTDTNNWAAAADKRLYPALGIGYRYGRVPEIFSVASPTAGLMFSNDVMPVKVRFFYGVGVIDYRGLYKHNL